MKTRILLSLMVGLLIAGLGRGVARAQAVPALPGQLMSMISFSQVATASPTTFTLIESLASYRIEVFQLRLYALDSLVSYKIRSAFGRPVGGTSDPRQGDITGVMRLSNLTSTESAETAQAFANLQPMIPDTRFSWLPYHFRLAPGARLQLELAGVGLSSVQVTGFAQFIYRPVIR